MSNELMNRLGLFVLPWGKVAPTPASIVELAQYAEELGYDSISTGWHATLPPHGLFDQYDNTTLLDPFVMLPTIAAKTERIRVGLNSSVLASQHPFTLAQYFATLDVASGGRVIPGGAVGWWDHDLRVGGATSSERGGRADEAMATMTALWRGETIEEPGRYWNSTGMKLGTRPIQENMPFWVGGGIPAIKRTAKWGSALLPLNFTPDQIRDEIRPKVEAASLETGRKVAVNVMAYACVFDRSGRDAERVTSWIRQVASPELVKAGRGEEPMIVGSPEECAQTLRAYLDAGAEYFVLDPSFHGVADPSFVREQWRRIAEEVVPLVLAG